MGWPVWIAVLLVIPSGSLRPRSERCGYPRPTGPPYRSGAAAQRAAHPAQQGFQGWLDLESRIRNENSRICRVLNGWEDPRLQLTCNRVEGLRKGLIRTLRRKHVGNSIEIYVHE